MLAWQYHLQPWKYCHHHTVSPAHLLYTPSSFLPGSLAEKLIAPFTIRTDPVTHQPGLCMSAMFSVGCIFSCHPSTLEFPPSQYCRFLHRTSPKEVNLLIHSPKGRAGPAFILSHLHIIPLCSQACQGSSLFLAPSGMLCFLFSSGSCSANNNPRSLLPGSCSKVAPSSPGISLLKCCVALGIKLTLCLDLTAFHHPYLHPKVSVLFLPEGEGRSTEAAPLSL